MITNSQIEELKTRYRSSNISDSDVARLNLLLSFYSIGVLSKSQLYKYVLNIISDAEGDHLSQEDSSS